MNEPQAIARRETRTPDQLIAEGREQANALMRVVKEAGLAKDLGGSKPHLEVEAWQTIGRFNGYLTDVVWTRPITEEGIKVGYEARAELVRIDDGAHLIGAEAECRFDEEIEKKDGTVIKRWDDDYAVRSMAQTRAQSKLGRMAFAWVAVLAGYSGTPAEEMDGVKRGGRKVEFPFGKHKGKSPADLTATELHQELSFWEKKVAEETNPKFKANNERLLKAIQESIAEKSAKVESSAAPTATVKGDGEVPSLSPPAGDPSPLEQEWVKVRELMEAKGWTEAKLTLWCRKTHGCGKEELDLLRVQGLVLHLGTQTEAQRSLV